MVTREVKEENKRVGFRIVDLTTGVQGWLAKERLNAGPRVGRYTVFSADLEQIGVEALRRAGDGLADIVLVDEIGPMEMTSKSFRSTVASLLESTCRVIATVKYGSHYEEVERASGEGRTIILDLTRENREKVLERVKSIVDQWMSNRR